MYKSLPLPYPSTFSKEKSFLLLYEEMAQQLRVLAALPEGLSSVPSQPCVTLDSVHPMSFSDIYMCTHAHTHTHACTIEIAIVIATVGKSLRSHLGVGTRLWHGGLPEEGQRARQENRLRKHS